MPATPSSPDRPRPVVTAFWCWVAGAVLTAALGMLTLSQGRHPFVVVAGALLVAVGLGQAFLAGRARKGDARFAAAGVGLAMASVAFLALLLLFGAGIAVVAVVAVTMALLIVGSLMIRKEESRQWLGDAR